MVLNPVDYLRDGNTLTIIPCVPGNSGGRSVSCLGTQHTSSRNTIQVTAYPQVKQQQQKNPVHWYIFVAGAQ